MKIILLDKIQNIGSRGDIIEVAPGFAKNYLFPREKALLATKKHIKLFDKKISEKIFLNKKTYLLDEKKINNLSILIPVSIYENKKFHGSINSNKIYKIINKLGFKLNKKHIKNDIIIKQVGDYQIELKLNKNIKTIIYLMIVKNN